MGCHGMKIFTVFFNAPDHAHFCVGMEKHDGNVTFGAKSQVNARSTATEQANIDNGQKQRPLQPSGALDQACEKRECAGANPQAGVGHHRSVEISSAGICNKLQVI